MTTTPSDQTWYTQFRIGTYLNDEFTYNEGSQFPQGEEVLDQFFRQMTPDTGMDNAAGGNSTVVHLPDEGITGNDHFMFQDLNNDVIAHHIEAWIQENVTQ